MLDRERGDKFYNGRIIYKPPFVNDDDDNDEELPPPSPSNVNSSHLNSSNGNNDIGKIDLFNASTTDLTNQQQEEFNHSQQKYPDLKWWKLTLTNKSNKFIKSNHRSSTSSNSISSSSIQNNQQSQIHRNRSNDNRNQINSFDDNINVDRNSITSHQANLFKTFAHMAKSELDDAALYRRSKIGKRTKKDKFRSFFLQSAYFPLLFRGLNVGFTTATLAVCVRIRLLESKYNVLGISGAGAIIGIIFSPMTLTHVMVSIYLEYFYGRPIGIWGIRSKMAHTLLDLVFIIFWSAELSLIFDNYFTSLLSCSNASPWWSDVSQANERTTDLLIDDNQKTKLCYHVGAAVGLVFVGLLLYVFNLVVSLYRIYERVRLHQVIQNDNINNI